VVDVIYPLLDPRLRTRVLAGTAPAAR